MSWLRRKKSWSIDPSSVEFGSVVEGTDRNLSRTHVRVKYCRTAAAEIVPLAAFVERSSAALRSGRALEIERLLVSPWIKQRHTEFFDRLTNWTPAARRALRDSSRRSVGPV